MKPIGKRERKKYGSILEKTFLFKNAPNIIERFVLEDERFQWEEYSKGEIIYDYDNYRNSLGIILKGRVSVKKEKGGSVLINTLKQGDAFGGSVIFSKANRFIATVRSEGRCAVLFISEQLMREIIGISPEVNMNYIEYLSESLIFLNERLDIFTAGDAQRRTAEYLKNNCCEDEAGGMSVMDFSMTALAEYLDIGRATLYRILSDFETRGIIKRDGRKIHIISDITKEI